VRGVVPGVPGRRGRMVEMGPTLSTTTAVRCPRGDQLSTGDTRRSRPLQMVMAGRAASSSAWATSHTHDQDHTQSSEDSCAQRPWLKQYIVISFT
jgi:hypothetical protein